MALRIGTTLRAGPFRMRLCPPGLGSAQVAALNQRFLESMREAAFADDVLTAGELRQPRSAAAALGVPGCFDDRRAEPAAPPAATGRAPRQRRCGNCRAPGRYRSTCPGGVRVPA